MPYFVNGDTSGTIAAPIILDKVSVSGGVFLGNIALTLTASTWGAGVSGSSSGSILFPAVNVTSSLANPLYITGSVTVDDITIQDVTLSQPSLTASTVTLMAASTSSVTLANGNTARKQLALYNGSGGPCYTKLGTGSSTASFTLIVAAGGYYELPTTSGIYTGPITGIWEAMTAGSASITEVT